MEWAIGVGSNKGNRAMYIRRAAEILSADPDMRLCAQADFLENPAQDAPSGHADAAYINSAWIIESNLGGHQILHRLQKIENALGRVRSVYHGARTIDLDLLLASDSRCIHSPVLRIPHPSMHLRDFVVRPLMEIAADWMHPKKGCTIAELATLLRVSADV